MSMELITLIGMGVTGISIGVALVVLILNTQRNLQADMAALREGMKTEFKAHREETRAEFKAVRAEFQAHREEARAEFKAVRAENQAQREETKAEFKAQREVIIGLLERMAHLEGLLEGLREAITGRRAAEAAGSYDPR